MIADWYAAGDAGTDSLLSGLLERDPRVHALMPCMALACGVDLLTGLRSGTIRHTLGAGTDAEPVTCPDCLARYGGRNGLLAESRRQQGHQAPIEGPS